MRTLALAHIMILAAGLFAGSCKASATEGNTSDPFQTTQNSEADQTRIQIAILLDTSNSMDGLIEQAKSRLWNIVNTVTTLKYKGVSPRIEIALYEYGNDRLSAAGNYIRQVTPLTTDLDLISEKLFALSTNGGEEYCGAVISEAVKKLDWGSQPSDMKLIYIAGNEPFTQGSIHYKEAITGALNKNIFVNTIFCGDYTTGMRESWKDGAVKGNGKYFNIDSDKKVRFIETPYDAKIQACNERMNDTYIGYGSMGVSKKVSQQMQDKNAVSVSSANYTERAVSKSKSAYKNESWDLVDKAEADQKYLSKINKKELPAEYQNKTDEELKAIVAEKTKERTALQNEIQELSRKRQTYIDAESKKTGSDDDLGAAINKSILDLAVSKGYAVSI